MEKLTFESKYEEGGYFDKDEQGWCANYVEISCKDGTNVKIRQFFDANGYIQSDSTRYGTVQSVSGGIVTILIGATETLSYSLKDGKLV